MTIEIVQQGSDAWRALRLGKVTASRVADILAKTKSGPSAMRANYAAQLVAERLTGIPTETFTTPAMARGSAKEAEARALYSFLNDVDVTEVGFVHHPRIAMAGASPDGVVSARGGVEIKCPNTATHIETLTSGAIPTKYQTQMLWQMACTGWEWCDYFSHDDRLPGPYQKFQKRMERDDIRIVTMEREVTIFLEEVEATIADLQRAVAREAA